MRFWNSGKYTHDLGRSKETGDMVSRELPIKVKGQNPGACIINFAPEFTAVVEQGEWVDVPENLYYEDHTYPHLRLSKEVRTERFVEMVKRQSPCLLTEDEAKAVGVEIETKRGPGRPLKLKE